MGGSMPAAGQGGGRPPPGGFRIGRYLGNRQLLCF